MLDMRMRMDTASPREMSKNGDLTIHRISSEHQFADILTKTGAI